MFQFWKVNYNVAAILPLAINRVHFMLMRSNYKKRTRNTLNIKLYRYEISFAVFRRVSVAYKPKLCK